MSKPTIRRLLPALGAVVAMALVLAAVALAAKPKDGTYGGKEISFATKGGKITEVSGGLGFKCNAVPIDLKKKIAVKKGKFHFSGKVKNVIGKPEGKLTFSGQFKTTKKATGKYKFVKAGCTRTAKFTAKFGASAA